jgi:hypothetical protein
MGVMGGFNDEDTGKLREISLAACLRSQTKPGFTFLSHLGRAARPSHESARCPNECLPDVVGQARQHRAEKQPAHNFNELIQRIGRLPPLVTQPAMLHPCVRHLSIAFGGSVHELSIKPETQTSTNNLVEFGTHGG